MDFLYGEIAEELPKDFAPPEAWEEFGAICIPPSLCSREEVGENPRGFRWSLWPFTFEQYIGDKEPNLEASKIGKLARNRIVLWRRVARRDAPKKWRAFSQKPWRIDGFHLLERNDDYTQKWHKNARREAKIWREQFLNTRYKIEEISFAEFAAAYKKSTAAKKIGFDLLRILGRKLTLPISKNSLVLWGARNMHSGEIIAGTVAWYPAAYSASVRECPFILSEAKSVYAAVGLIDHWFEESQKRGVGIQIFTCFWQPGEPRGWKSFSEFKSHFGLRYAAYPPLLWRFVRGKIF